MSAAVANLAEGCASGNYYEALMHFKTVFNRKITGRTKNVEKAITLLVEGLQACVGAGAGGAAAAADLAVQLFVLFEAFEMKHEDASLAMVEKISNAFGGASGSQIKEINETHKLFLHRAFVWTKHRQTPQGDVTSQYGDFLHLRLAQLYEAEGQDLKAYKHIINVRMPSKSGTKTDGAGMNVDDQLAVITGKIAGSAAIEEQPVFVCRSLLQILCRTRPYTDETYTESRNQSIETATGFLGKALARLPKAVVDKSMHASFAKSFLTVLSVNRQFDEEDDAGKAAATAVDALLEVYLPLLKASDEHLSQLAVIAANEQKATIKHKKAKSNGGGGLLGALLGGA